MSEQPRTIDLQIDHPAVDDLQKDFKPRSLRAHVLSLIHRYPYEQLLVQAKNRKVLELGCNKGYGTVIYAESADSVKAVDTSSEAIEKARELNSRDNIEYVCLQSWTLPFEDDAFDLTVLFQVIEHIALDKRDIFLREIKRVTRAEGEVIVTTPNRNIRLLPFQRPWNKFHTKEYSAQDLKQLLSDYFAEVRVDGLFGVESLNRIERRRVKQKPARVYLKEPLRKYLIRPILSLLTGKPGAVSGGASARKTKAKADNADSSQSNAAASKPSDYPYTLSDLEFRDQALHEALDLKATVLRIK